MNRNVVYALVACLLLGLLGVTSLWGYRRYQRKRDQEWEASVTLSLQAPLTEEQMKKCLEEENGVLHRKELLTAVVRKLDLIPVLHLTTEEQAVQMLREKSQLRKGNVQSVVLSFRHKDRELASRISKALMEGFLQAQQGPAPEDPLTPRF